jgi:putative transposase
MKTSKYSDSQIMAILKQAEAGVTAPELCREHGMSSATVHQWQAKYGGMDASLMKCMKELEDENRRLKKMYAEKRLKYKLRQEALEKEWSSPRWCRQTILLHIIKHRICKAARKERVFLA